MSEPADDEIDFDQFQTMLYRRARVLRPRRSRQVRSARARAARRVLQRMGSKDVALGATALGVPIAFERRDPLHDAVADEILGARLR